jgi:hypothetical protein
MVKHTVLIQITGAAQFRAEVEVDTDELNADMPPMHMTGTFIRFDGYEAICKALVHTDRFDGGSTSSMNGRATGSRWQRRIPNGSRLWHCDFLSTRRRQWFSPARTGSEMWPQSAVVDFYYFPENCPFQTFVVATVNLPFGLFRTHARLGQYDVTRAIQLHTTDILRDGPG